MSEATSGPLPALVALGSNDGPRRTTLRAAARELRDLARGEVRLSPFYVTRPVGMAAGARSVLNAACTFDTNLEPEVLLTALLELETRFGRTRASRREPSGDRTLDLDLLLLGAHIGSTPALTLPHPRLHERAFVLVPACDIAPDWTHPALGRTLRELLLELPAADVRAVRSGVIPRPSDLWERPE